MPKARIESLLTSFPKLIPPHSQHTSIETSEVRYVYQPLEDLYILLITNKASNILQDIDTLHLFARVVSDLCRSAEEKEILKNAFELLGSFDEIVSLGYREKINLTQVRGVLEMESHEEKIQEIIARVRSPILSITSHRLTSRSYRIKSWKQKKSSRDVRNKWIWRNVRHNDEQHKASLRYRTWTLGRPPTLAVILLAIQVSHGTMLLAQSPAQNHRLPNPRNRFPSKARV